MEVTGGMQNKTIALETRIKRKEMGCFLFRNKFFLSFIFICLCFFLIDSSVQTVRWKIIGNIKLGKKYKVQW